MKFYRPQQEMPDPRYEHAKSKAEEIIAKIDPDLTVTIREITVHEKEPDEHRATVLRFVHEKNTEMHWTMEIDVSDDYLENDLEDAIKKAYRKQAWESHDPELKKRAGLLL